jgi:hypothetical protein
MLLIDCSLSCQILYGYIIISIIIIPLNWSLKKASSNIMNNILKYFWVVSLLPLATPMNPINQGHYADPEASIHNALYHIHPTTSAPYKDQTYFDAFTSENLVEWRKHEKILTKEEISWAEEAMWAPAVVKKGSQYFLFFSANDVGEGEIGGIGVAVGASPVGPFSDHIGAPLINDVVNGAQPIDQFIYEV